MKHVHPAGMSDKTRSGFLGQFQLTRAVPLRRTFLALLAVCFAAGLGATHAAQPSLRPLVESGKWPAWPRGQPADIAVAGNHAYVALRQGGLGIYDVSDPGNPMQVGSVAISRRRSGGAIGVTVSGAYAFVAKGEDGMDVVDVRNPARPRVVGNYRGYCADVAVSGRFAHLAGWSQGLTVVDVGNPANPRRVGGYDDEPIGERFNSVVVSGNHAFVSGDDWTGSGFVYFIHAIDVSNPTNCVRVGSYTKAGSYTTPGSMAIDGHHIYINEGTNGLKVIDFSAPSHPVAVGHYDQPGDFGPVAVFGDYAYLARGQNGLEILDVRDPSHPMRVGGYPGRFVALSVSDSHVYGINGEGWEIVDATNPTLPFRTAVHTIADGNARAVAVSGHFAYVADGGWLQIINALDPHHPVRVGGYEIGGSARSVVVSGNYAYVADEWHGLQVIDVSNPADCRQVAGDPPNSFGGVLDVAISGDHLYVAKRRGFSVLEVSDPAAPVPIGGHDTEAPARAIFLSGGRAYVAAGTNGLIIVDVSDPTNCLLLGRFSLPGSAADVVVSGSRAYVTRAGEGDWEDMEMAVLDVTDPAHVVWVSEFDDDAVHALALSAHHLYATSGSGNRLRVFDLNDPATNLEDWGEIGVVQNIAWPTWGVAAANGRIYVAAGPAGLIVIPTIPDIQLTVRVDADPGTPFPLEAATDLSAPNPWSPLLTTNVSAMPFDYVDYDVKLSEKPRKFYRVRQP
jgi:hypothetical protein